MAAARPAESPDPIGEEAAIMIITEAERIPVIIGVGQVNDRPEMPEAGSGGTFPRLRRPTPMPRSAGRFS